MHTAVVQINMYAYELAMLEHTQWCEVKCGGQTRNLCVCVCFFIVADGIHIPPTCCAIQSNRMRACDRMQLDAHFVVMCAQRSIVVIVRSDK